MSMRRLWRELGERRLRRRSFGQRLLRAFADAYPEASFLEIGAGDGVTADHLRPFVVSRPWHGIMVEPVPYVFEQLRRKNVHVPAAPREACDQRLHRHGYATMVEFLDTWCLDTKPDDALTAAWHRLCRRGPAVSREDLDRWFAATRPEDPA
jgi:hypothetical protein